MRALVTGAAGFLGSHIVDDCLRRGDRVRVLVRETSDVSYLKTLPEVEIVRGDLLSREALDRATRDIDVVHHSAARVLDYGSRSEFWDANVIATSELLDAARTNGVRRFVLVSSPSVVTDQKDQRGIDESYPYPRTFINLYSETKAKAEQIVLAANAADFVTCAIRPRAVWGPRDKNGFLPRILWKILSGKLPDMSGGRQVLASLCFCTNAAEACSLAARSDRVGGKTYFVTDGETTDVWAFAREVGALFGAPPIARSMSPKVADGIARIIETVWMLPALANHRSPPLSRYSVGLLSLHGTYDIGAAERDFGYRPAVTRSAGLERLKAWVDAIGGVDELTRYVR